ncbi:MAG: type II toxin-antitoxin system PemK/MazF family toxin [Actinomycetota bacterium]
MSPPVPRRGEVWWYEHPDAMRRPYVVLTRSEAAEVLHQLVAAPATTTVRDIPTEVPLDRADGMPVDCVLNLDNVTLVRTALLTERITVLDPSRMDECCAALAAATDC